MAEDPQDLTASLARLKQKARVVRAVDNTDNDLAVAAAEWQQRIPKRFRDARIDSIVEPMRGRIVEWLHDGCVENLLLLGSVGTGKTYAGIAALRWLHFDDGRRVLFAPVSEALDALRPGGPEDAAARLRNVDVLMLDDLGNEKTSEWTLERLDSIVNRRWLDERATIITTNVEPERLEASLDPRLFSRLIHGALAIEMSGNDRRRA